MAGLLEQRIIQPVGGTQPLLSAGTVLSFEQQKELLLLKQTHELQLQVQLQNMKQQKDLALKEMKQ